MTREEYLKELDKAFGDFKFFESDHHYEYKCERVGMGVTTFIGQFGNEFNAEEKAKNTALKTNRSITDVLNEWAYKRDFACDKGSTMHEYSQSLWSEAGWKLIPFDLSQKYLEAVEKIKKQARNFYNDFKDRLTHLYDEYIIGSQEYNLSSAIDHLFINKLTGGLVLVDYKTNTDIYKGDKYAKEMKHPLEHLKDTKLSHYYLQLSIYKYIVEKYTDLKIEDMFIVWLSEENENYQIIEIPYLKKEVKKILELRRVNEMGKMLLVIGEGGTGKTSSLRKLSPKEHFYIDCDKKGLNYKGWKNDYIEKKNYYRTNDGEIVGKLLREISKNKPEFKYITIDTINSIMIADEMKRMKGKSYNEWQDLAKCIFDIIDIVPDLRDDLTVIFIGHTQTDEDGFTRLLTNGRKLNKIGLEKYFNTVLLAKAKDGDYVFETRANNSTARTPIDAFDELEIPNDITKVLEVIQDY